MTRPEEFENNGNYAVAGRNERFLAVSYMTAAPPFHSAVRPNYTECAAPLSIYSSSLRVCLPRVCSLLECFSFVLSSDHLIICWRSAIRCLGDRSLV